MEVQVFDDRSSMDSAVVWCDLPPIICLRMSARVRVDEPAFRKGEEQPGDEKGPVFPVGWVVKHYHSLYVILRIVNGYYWLRLLNQLTADIPLSELQRHVGQGNWVPAKCCELDEPGTYKRLSLDVKGVAPKSKKLGTKKKQKQQREDAEIRKAASRAARRAK